MSVSYILSPWYVVGCEGGKGEKERARKEVEGREKRRERGKKREKERGRESIG